MSVNRFASDYIAMSGSTLNMSGWDIFYPTGYVEPNNSSAYLKDLSYYEGDWVGIRALEDTYCIAESNAGENYSKLQNNSFDDQIDSVSGFHPSEVGFSISSGDIIYGQFRRVKVLKGLAAGIRATKGEFTDINIKKNSSGYYNPEDFPGCIARYDSTGLIRDADNEYGNNSAYDINRWKNLSTYTNQNGLKVPDFVSLDIRKNYSPALADDYRPKATTGPGVAPNGSPSVKFSVPDGILTMQTCTDAQDQTDPIFLNCAGSPITIVTVMKRDDLITGVTSGDIGKYLFMGDTEATTSLKWGIMNHSGNGGEVIGTNETVVGTSGSSYADTDWHVHIATYFDIDSPSNTEWYENQAQLKNEDQVVINDGEIFNDGNIIFDQFKGLTLGVGANAWDIDAETSTTLNTLAGASNQFNWFEGEVTEILIYNKVLSNFEQNEITKFLVNKWNIP